MKMNFCPDPDGFYGEFGGAFVPEMLQPNVTELRENYLDILQSADYRQEFNQLLELYVGRPTPLYPANNLSAHYETNIFLKREDLCHTGAHKINNALGQVLLAQKLGKSRIIAETGAGQHGVATATACALLNMECKVYMGSKDMERQFPNVARMKMLGADVVSVNSGSRTLKDATNEAIRDWINHPTDTHYVIGSVVGPHPYPDLVARLQAIISQEIKQQLEGSPDCVIACIGGGSNAMGAFYHFLRDASVQLVGVEAAGKGLSTNQTAATLSLGTPGVLHGSMTQLLQTSEGQVIEPYSISAGLDYPGVGPQHAYLHQMGRVTYASITDAEALKAAHFLAKTEGIIPALESAHALAYLDKHDFFPHEQVVVSLSGRGDKDLDAFIQNNEHDC